MLEKNKKKTDDFEKKTTWRKDVWEESNVEKMTTETLLSFSGGDSSDGGQHRHGLCPSTVLWKGDEALTYYQLLCFIVFIPLVLFFWCICLILSLFKRQLFFCSRSLKQIQVFFFKVKASTSYVQGTCLVFFQLSNPEAVGKSLVSLATFGGETPGCELGQGEDPTA